MVKKLPAKKKRKRNYLQCGRQDLGLIPGSGKPPGEGMATHFSILALRIPWIGEPGRLQSMVLQRVGQTVELSLTHASLKSWFFEFPSLNHQLVAETL